MSLFVVLALEAEPNTNEMNAVADKLGYQIEYDQDIQLKAHSGFLPAKVDGESSGVEAYSFLTSELPEQLKPQLPGDYLSGVVYQLRFGGNPIEAQAAFTSAIVISTTYNGITIEDQAGALLTVEQLTEALAIFKGM